MTDIGARALALAEAEIKRLMAALEVERQISNAARIYIMYTEAKYPGDEQQIDMLIKWLEACKKRQGAE